MTTYIEQMDYLLEAIIVASAILGVGLLIWRAVIASHRTDGDDKVLTLLQNQVNASTQQTGEQVEALRKTMAEAIKTLNSQVTESLSLTNKSVSDRIDNTTKVIGDVRQQLGQLKESSERIIEVGKDISKLEDVLSPPKLRGSLGELFLADLLAQIMPSEHYSLQYTFKGGETVDAVVILNSGMVPIDAKFPLENFRRIFSTDNETDRKSAKKAFVKDVKKHIDAISSKYIRMDENTFDFALMYIPAENVYYETIIKDEDQDDSASALFNYALQKRVIPVSPNSFYAYLQTIILGLKGMRVEEKSRDIIDNLSRLQKEFDNFAESFRLVGQHLDNSSKKYQDAQKRFGKVESKVEQIDGLAKGLSSQSQKQLPPN